MTKQFCPHHKGAAIGRLRAGGGAARRAAGRRSPAQGVRRDCEVTVDVEQVRRVRQRRLGGAGRRRSEARLPQGAVERPRVGRCAGAGAGEVGAGAVGDLGDADPEPLAGVEAEEEVGGAVDQWTEAVDQWTAPPPRGGAVDQSHLEEAPERIQELEELR